MNPVFSRRDYGKSLVFVLSLLAVGYLLYHTLAGGTLLTQNVYDSYALQAQNWLHGRIDIENGVSYTWLELAIYQGRYYLSFPPLPSLCSLPFVWLFGSSPSNLLIALWAMGGFVCVFGCFHAKGYPPHLCAFWGFFLHLCHQSGGVLPERRGVVPGPGPALLPVHGEPCGPFARGAGTSAWPFSPLAVGCRPFCRCVSAGGRRLFPVAGEAARGALLADGPGPFARGFWRCWPLPGP